jgi:methionyl aminopeptidase
MRSASCCEPGVIIRKSAAELDKMRRAGAITAGTIDRVLEAVVPGATTLDLDRIAEAFIRSEGATPSFLGYKGFTGSICASINEEIVHGIPAADRVLADGDLVSLDFGAVWDGFHSDAAVTVFVGAPPSDDAKRLAETTASALDEAIAVMRPGGRLSDIGFAIEQVALAQGLGVIREYGGHGIGRALHEDPFIQNWGAAGRGPELKPGLVVAIEPMLTLGGDGTRVLDDAWTVVTADGSLSAHFEHTVAITDDGHEVLTAR